MDKKQRDIIIKLNERIFPVIAVVVSIIGILGLSKEFTDLGKNYKEIILSAFASLFGILISFFALKILKQKRGGNIFISYSHKDKKFVDKLVQNLKIKRFNIIYDDEIIMVGDNIKDVVLKTIENSDVIIMVLSESITQEAFVSYELKYAIERNKKILPVLIESNANIPLELKNIKYVDFSKEYENNLNLLIKSLIATLEDKDSGHRLSKLI